MHFRIVLFFVQLAIFCHLSDVVNAKAMIGQNIRPARDNEYPFVVSIMRVMQENNQMILKHFCTGSLISVRDVLTSEHCLANEKQHLVRVMVGSHDLKYGTKINVLWWISYSQWSQLKNIITPFQNNDISIIRLESDVNNITPAMVSNTLTFGFYGLNVVAAGWGKIENGNISPLMRLAGLKVITNSNCERRVERIQGQKYSVPPRYLCTVAEPFALLHSGDSGGPLIYNGEIIAVSISTCPLPETVMHPDKVNLHLVLEYYADYIRDVKNIHL